MPNAEMPKKPRKMMDEFKLRLPHLRRKYSEFSGGTFNTYGYSPLSALRNLLRAFDSLEFEDELYHVFRGGSCKADISLLYTPSGQPESTRDVPELDRLRREVAKYKGITLAQARKMRYSGLYATYRELNPIRQPTQASRRDHDRQTYPEYAKPHDASKPHDGSLF